MPAIAFLLRRLRDDATKLVRQELTLAKAELNENLQDGRQAVLGGIIGGFIAVAGMALLVIAFTLGVGIALINYGMDPELVYWLTPLVIGLAMTIVGLLITSMQLKAEKFKKLKPNKTMQTLKEDKRWAVEKLH